QFGGRRDVQLFVEELMAWHDEMVQHRRVVAQLGPDLACSDTCPHQTGRRLWREAREILGPKADTLIFLRACATQPVAEEREREIA
ncbi:MAG TPA: hypothetical protein PLT35_12720, partial [Vicinamibacterales bacterium]|nr:hypothetical protein [Vicinamibacterales bacterium]